MSERCAACALKAPPSPAAMCRGAACESQLHLIARTGAPVASALAAAPFGPRGAGIAHSKSRWRRCDGGQAIIIESLQACPSAFGGLRVKGGNALAKAVKLTAMVKAAG